jgi:phage shock protein PspC (stress-responsive transcriptional regulator)
MTDTTESPSEPVAPARRLERPRDGRRLAGVAEGLGRHFDIDPAFIRIAFAVSAIFGGIGFLLYALAWLAMPQEGAGKPTVTIGRDGSPWLTYVAAGLAIVMVLDVITYGSFGWYDGFGLRGLLLALASIAIVAVAVAVRPLGRAALVACALASVAAIGASIAMIDVPMRGGIGSRDWAPAFAARHTYRLGIGDAELDLTDISDPKVDSVVTVGAGNLTVVVPASAWVDIDARAGVGRVDVLGRPDDGVDAHRHVIGDGDLFGPTIRLDIRVGIGNVEVVRAS